MSTGNKASKEELEACQQLLLKRAADARIRARYHPTLEQQYQELERAQRLEAHARSETIFGQLS